MNPALQSLLLQEVESLGFDVVELRLGGTAKRPLLDVRIDRKDGARVTIADCALVSKGIEPRIDASGLLSGEYVLEVSSPGAERILRNAQDWKRFAGRRARVLSEPLGGRVEVSVVGVEVEGEVEIAVVRDEMGNERRCALADVKEARLALVWK